MILLKSVNRQSNCDLRVVTLISTPQATILEAWSIYSYFFPAWVLTGGAQRPARDPRDKSKVKEREKEKEKEVRRPERLPDPEKEAPSVKRPRQATLRFQL